MNPFDSGAVLGPACVCPCCGTVVHRQSSPLVCARCGQTIRCLPPPAIFAERVSPLAVNAVDLQAAVSGDMLMNRLKR